MHEISNNFEMHVGMQERKELMKRFPFDRGKMINDNSKIYGPCMCKTTFHRLTRDLET